MRAVVALALALATSAIAQPALEKKLNDKIQRFAQRTKIELRMTLRRQIADLEKVSALPAARRKKIDRLLEIVERTPYWMLNWTAVDLERAELIAMPVMIARLAKARVVGVAEQHDNAGHHLLQARVAGMLDAWGKTAIGVEMMTRDRQALLDRYTSLEIDEKTFLEELNWKKTWGFDWKIYAPIWRTARSRRMRMTGINIPRTLVRAVGRKGLDGVGAEIRKQLPAEIDTTVKSHRARFFRLVRHHPTQKEGNARMNRMYEAMCVWDEAMAESAVDFLKKHPELKRIVIVAGSGHLAYHDGIPARAARRGAGPVMTVIPRSVGTDHVSQLRADLLRPPGRFVVFVR